MYIGIKRLIWACILLLLLFSGCGEIDVKFDGCSTCPDRCLQDQATQRGICVACVKDEQCRTPESLTRICNQSNRCICGSDNDCSAGQRCAASGSCVACLEDKHCLNPRQSVCFDSQCLECKPNDEKACSPTGIKVCQEGTQRCQGGTWSKCAGWKPCAEEQCPVTQIMCQKECIDPFAHGKHCGQCDRACTAGKLCAGGACVATCPQATPTVCLGGCVELQSNSLHCGKCGNPCRADQRCVDGLCQCPRGTLDCTSEGQSRCVDTSAHAMHCGRCNRPCEAGQVCSEGRCLATCPKATPTVCLGGCVALPTNAFHCGACGNSCRADQRCVSGVCTCLPDARECTTGALSACTFTQSNRLHCGLCQQPCQDDEYCEAGQCVSRCTNNRTLCQGGCIDLQMDPAHCGACQQPCGVQELCEKGKCIPRQSWTITGGGIQQDEIKGLQVDAAGNIYAAGFYTEKATFGAISLSANGNDKNSFVLKLDPTGKVVWFITAKSESNNKAYGLATGPQGSVYITGYFTGDIAFGDFSLPNRGRGDIYVAKFDSTGKCSWAIGMGDSGEDLGKAIVVAPSGASYVTGFFEETINMGSTQLKSKGDEDIFLTKIDNDGKILWAHSSGGKSTDEGFAIGLDGNEQVYVTGRFKESMLLGQESLQSKGGQDIFLYKADSVGRILWAKSFGGTDDDKPRGIAVKSTGEIALTGEFEGTIHLDTRVLLSKGLTDIFVLMLDTKGQILWALSAGGSKDDRAVSATFTPKGELLVAGSFQGIASFGATQLLTNLAFDTFLFKLDTTGQFLWARAMNIPGNDQGQYVATDAAGTPYLGLDFTGVAVLGTTNFPSRGDTDILITKIP